MTNFKCHWLRSFRSPRWCYWASGSRWFCQHSLGWQDTCCRSWAWSCAATRSHRHPRHSSDGWNLHCTPKGSTQTWSMANCPNWSRRTVWRWERRTHVWYSSGAPPNWTKPWHSSEPACQSSTSRSCLGTWRLLHLDPPSQPSDWTHSPHRTHSSPSQIWIPN